MINRIWIIWVAIEIAATLTLAALWPANASAAPKWECTSAGGWSMAIDGHRTFVPVIIKTNGIWKGMAERVDSELFFNSLFINR